MHPLLRRQLRRAGLGEDALTDARIVLLLERVSATYEDADRDRYTLERSLTTSSAEMQSLYAELRGSEANFKAVVERSPDAIFVYEGEVIRYANPAMAVLLGAPSVAPIVGLPIAQLLDPADVERLREYRREGAGSFACRWVRLDGRRVDIESVNARIVFDGRPATVVIGRDVSALRAAEQRHRALFAGSPLPLIVFEQKTLEIVDVNDAATRLYGFSREELIGMSFAALKPADDLPELVHGVATRRPGEVWAAVRRHRRKDGTLVEVEVTAQDMTLDGRAVILATCNDLTERRRLEEQLRQSQKMDALGQLAGGIAHDFNNMLSAISSYAELAIEGSRDGADVESDLQQIVDATQRASALSRQLLVFSRGELYQPGAVAVDRVLRDLRGMLSALLGPRVQLEVRIPERIPRVVSQAAHVEQIIVNLAVNARDAMPSGGRLTIALLDAALDERDARELGCPPGRYVRISVRDEGCGMDEATRARIFEPFFTTKPMGKGTGLGLAIVFRIVKQHNGAIRVESRPNAGSTFDVFFPVSEADDAKPQATPSDHPRTTVLLVDDDPHVRAATERMLRRLGHDVVSADGVATAIAKVQDASQRIDAVVSDVVMPDVDGYTLVERLRELRPGLRAMFISGYAPDARQQPEHAFLAKPFTLAELEQALRALLA